MKYNILHRCSATETSLKNKILQVEILANKRSCYMVNNTMP